VRFTVCTKSPSSSPSSAWRTLAPAQTTLIDKASISLSHHDLFTHKLPSRRQSLSAASLRAIADTPHTKCSHCFKPASLLCSGCKIHVYCDTGCQKRNWSTHKFLCKEARLELAVYRAAETFTKVYFAFRERIFDRVITKIENKPGGLYIWEDDTAVKKNGWFAEFPDNLTEDMNVKAAALFFQMCSEPYGYLKDVIELLFKGKTFGNMNHSMSNRYLSGLDIKLEEVDIQLKKPVPRSTTIVYADGRSYNTGIGTLHSIMRVTSATSGKSWAVDVTGKQLGINECCMTWTKYRATYVKDTKRIYKHGKLWLFFKAAQNIPGYHTLNTSINFDAADYVVQAIKKWASDEELAFSKMLYLTKKHYD
jgi:hypothetical protein